MSLEERLEEASRAWAIEGTDADLGLWWIAGDVRDLMPDASEEEVRRTTLMALRPLLSAGALRAGDMLPTGKFKAWDGSVDEQLARIDEGWKGLGRPPDIGDIVWFIGNRS